MSSGLYKKEYLHAGAKKDVLSGEKSKKSAVRQK